jgi:hypothetical protein
MDIASFTLRDTLEQIEVEINAVQRCEPVMSNNRYLNHGCDIVMKDGRQLRVLEQYIPTITKLGLVK